jgi:tripartite-type tricarboxylate transporter receptor subunit TctC
MKSFSVAVAQVAWLVATLMPSGAHAQAYPSKPIRLVVPYAPGGATDIIARAAASELSKTIGQPVTVDNRPGAGGNLGAELVAKAPADGYTMLMSPSSLHGITPFLYSKLTYDPNKDLTPIVALGGLANVLVINTEIKANTVAELVALIKAQPGKFSFASSGSVAALGAGGQSVRREG